MNLLQTLHVATVAAVATALLYAITVTIVSFIAIFARTVARRLAARDVLAILRRGRRR